MKKVKFEDLFKEQTIEALNKSKSEKEVKESLARSITDILTKLTHFDKKQKKTVH